MIYCILVAAGFLIVSSYNAYALSEAEEDESRRNESAQVALWEEKLFESQGKPDKVKMSELWLGLRNMGYRKSRLGHSPKVDVIYQKLQSELLSIPGHAEFYAKSIWESYAAYRDSDHPKHSGSADWFSRESQYALETLQHLPSPETLRVLGEMLDEEWQRVLPPESTVQTVPSALAKQAAWTLIELPLRDMPTPHFERNKAKDHLSAWQQWYAEVKSGQRTFSFKGQAVEYRFNPDGTWQTIPIANPPDDTPKPPIFEKSESKPERQAKKLEKPRETKKPIWVWVVPTGLLVSGILLWFLTKRRTANGHV